MIFPETRSVGLRTTGTVPFRESVMAAFSITLAMSAADATALSAAGMSLCLLRTCSATQRGNPVVWYSTPRYGTSTPLRWTETFGVFSAAALGNPPEINPDLAPNDSGATALGRLWQIADGNTGILVPGTPPPASNAVQIDVNAGSWTVGVAISPPGTSSPPPAPFCAFSVLANSQVVVAPTSCAILYFDTALVDVGTVVTRPYSEALMIALSPGSEQSATYSVAKGWRGNVGGAFTQLAATDVVAAAVGMSHHLVVRK